MKVDENTYETIDLYLNGELEAEALQSFVDKLGSDTDFSILVCNQKVANDIILGNRLSVVKQMMDSDFKSKYTKNNNTKWAIGGLLGLSLLTCSILYLNNTASITSSKQYVETKKTILKSSSNLSYQNTNNGNNESNKKSTKPMSLAQPIIKNPVASNYKNSDFTNSISSTSEKKSLNKNTQLSIDTIYKKNSITENSINTKYQTNILEDSYITNQKTDICAGVTIEAILTVDASCLNKNNGELHINKQSLKGGQSPYTYVLITQTNDTIRQEKTSFVSLPKGQYKLYFEDANKCSSEYKKPIYVNEKSCNTGAHSFSPHSGEHFNYPISLDSDAEIIIYNRSGQIVQQTTVLKGESNYWDGTNQNGQLLSTGLYIYIIKYTSGTKETGEVVIF